MILSYSVYLPKANKELGGKTGEEIISELYPELLSSANELAEEKLEKLISQDVPLKVLFKERKKAGGTGRIYVGLWPKNHNDPNSELEKKYIIHRALGGKGRLTRNVELNKITEYLVAEEIIKEILPEQKKTAYIPTIIGQKIEYEDKENEILNRDFYVTYEPRHLIFSEKVDGIIPLDYAYFLGKNVARFMFCGMVNVSRHYRPNLVNNEYRLCMIDLDSCDPHTFRWIKKDSFKKISHERMLEREVITFKRIADYFFISLLPKDKTKDKELIQKLKSIYREGFIEEVIGLKNIDISHRFKF